MYIDRSLRREEIELTGSLLVDADLARSAILPEPEEPGVPGEEVDLPLPGTTSGGEQMPFPTPNVPVPPSRLDGAPKHTSRLRMETDKPGAFRAFRAIQNLSDRSDRMAVQIEIQAESDTGFDALGLRNAGEEPLDEAYIDIFSELS